MLIASQRLECKKKERITKLKSEKNKKNIAQ